MRILALLLLTLTFFACGDRPSEARTEAASSTTSEVTETTVADDNVFNNVTVHPIYHGSVVLETADQVIFVDPHGGAERYLDFGAPAIVMITHTHGDHMDKSTLGGIDLSRATLIAPAAVMEEMEDVEFAAKVTLANGESETLGTVAVEAVPAYNLPKAEDAFHPPGVFNSYLVTIEEQRFYFSGDTEDIKEMRALENVDVAFICMNQPYTMTVEQAADAVSDFQPTVVYPYHYRNQDGTKSDLEQFATILSETAPTVDVRIRDWYQEPTE